PLMTSFISLEVTMGFYQLTGRVFPTYGHTWCLTPRLSAVRGTSIVAQPKLYVDLITTLYRLGFYAERFATHINSAAG
ncbi:MAG: hypothetical protein AAFN81_33840, partial [Bacteroidota bacterium]